MKFQQQKITNKFQLKNDEIKKHTKQQNLMQGGIVQINFKFFFFQKNLFIFIRGFELSQKRQKYLFAQLIFIIIRTKTTKNQPQYEKFNPLMDSEDNFSSQSDDPITLSSGFYSLKIDSQNSNSASISSNPPHFQQTVLDVEENNRLDENTIGFSSFSDSFNPLNHAFFASQESFYEKNRSLYSKSNYINQFYSFSNDMNSSMEQDISSDLHEQEDSCQSKSFQSYCTYNQNLNKRKHKLKRERSREKGRKLQKSRKTEKGSQIQEFKHTSQNTFENIFKKRK